MSVSEHGVQYIHDSTVFLWVGWYEDAGYGTAWRGILEDGCVGCVNAGTRKREVKKKDEQASSVKRARRLLGRAFSRALAGGPSGLVVVAVEVSPKDLFFVYVAASSLEDKKKMEPAKFVFSLFGVGGRRRLKDGLVYE